MKSQVLSLCFALSAALAVGQNLVPNPSFEEYTDCPQSPLEWNILGAYPWTTFRNSPDFFHECDETGMMSTPSSLAYGYQVPFHGVGQAGFIAQAYNHPHREVLGIELTEPLTPGVSYYVTMQIVRGWGGSAHSNCNCGVNNNGVRFTTREYGPGDWIPINNVVHIYQREVYMDTVNWMQVHGWFTADSAYTHLAIGNFFEPAFNTVINLNGYDFLNTYYFVDAVCVSSNLSDCEWAMGQSEHVSEMPTISVFPNPFNDHLTVKADRVVTDIELFDASGRTVLNERPMLRNVELTTELLSQGLYMATLRFENGQIISQKLIKQ
jgi:hypothetical protein